MTLRLFVVVVVAVLFLFFLFFFKKNKNKKAKSFSNTQKVNELEGRKNPIYFWMFFFFGGCVHTGLSYYWKSNSRDAWLQIGEVHYESRGAKFQKKKKHKSLLPSLTKEQPLAFLIPILTPSIQLNSWIMKKEKEKENFIRPIKKERKQKSWTVSSI